MKYSKTRVKCSDELLTDLDHFKGCCNDNEIVMDFINETQEGIVEIMSLARLTHDINEDGTVYSEFMMTIPKEVWAYVRKYIEGKGEGYQDIELFFEEISRLQEEDFKR